MHRGFFFGRLLVALLIGGLLFSAASGLFRSGYRQGFVQGAALSTADGKAVDPPAVYGAVRPFGWGHGWGHGWGFPPFLGFGFLVLFVWLLVGARHRHWRYRHHGWGYPQGGHPGWEERRRGGSPIGPEKQPQDYV